MAIAMQLAWLSPNACEQTSHFSAERKRPWSEDSEKMLQLMMGQFEQRTETLDLLGGSTTAPLLELDLEKPLPCGWEKCLDLKTGAVYYMNPSVGTKTLNDPREPLRFFAMTQPTMETSMPSDAFSASRDDRVKKEAAAYLPLRPMQDTRKTQNMLTQFEVKVKQKSSLEAESSVSHEPTSVDGLPRRGRKSDCISSVEDGICDGGLELKLKLGSNSVSSKGDKAASGSKLPTLLGRDWLERKIVSSASSHSQSDTSRARTCSAVEAASTSSSHSFLSLQTRDDSAMHSEGGGAIANGEAESKKTERGDQMMEIVGCPRCLMYVMLCKMDPRCPKCGSSVLLDFPSSSGFSSSSKRPRLA